MNKTTIKSIKNQIANIEGDTLDASNTLLEIEYLISCKKLSKEVTPRILEGEETHLINTLCHISQSCLKIIKKIDKESLQELQTKNI